MTPYGRRKLYDGEEETPSLQQRLEALRVEPVSFKKWQIALLILVVISLCGATGFWYSQRRLRNAPMPTVEAQAVKIVLLTDGSPDGTIDEQVANYIDKLTQENKLEALPGWTSAALDGNTCKVTFTFVEKNILQPQVMEWTVNLAERKAQAENDFARRFTR